MNQAVSVQQQVQALVEDTKTDDLTALMSAIEGLEQLDGFETKIRVVLLRNYTAETIEPYLKFHLYASGMQPEISFGGYDTVHQDLIASDSPVHSAPGEIVVLSLMLDQLAPQCHQPGWQAEQTLEELGALLQQALQSTQSLLVLNTFLPPFYPHNSISVIGESTDFGEQVEKLNHFLRQFVREHNGRCCLIDWGRLLRLLGEQQAMDYRYWYLAKAPFKKAFLDLYAQQIAIAVRALKGKAKKCIVLDCDNTLWGGIIGEDGLHGIQLDKHDYPGKAFYDFQLNLLQLKQRGVLLALCSKNNEQEVWDVLEQHPSCPLKRSDLAAWRINWQDKVSNLLALAEELNLGLDSFVMVDDSDFECDHIRQALPEVKVLQVPARLYDYPVLLLRDGLFDTLSLSNEDQQRTAMYQAEGQRRSLQRQYEDMEKYLASLQIIARIHQARPEGLARVAQLTQKTNQFNLTTRRYSEADIHRLAQDENSAIYSLSVQDRFGDLGLVGVFIANYKPTQRAAIIDSFLLSCRALGRGLEDVFASRAMDELEQRWEIEKWQAAYRPTRKNAQVAEFWPGLGFETDQVLENEYRYEIGTEKRQAVVKPYIILGE